MSKSSLAFLNDISVVAQDQPKKSRGGGGSRKEWNPQSGLVLRIWKDGRVFPSQELVDKFDLEYPNYPVDKEAAKLVAPGHGFDVIDSSEWPAFKTPQRVLVIIPSLKTEDKISLFGSTVYEPTASDPTITEPTSSVMDQGAASFGKDFLIPRIEEVYGVVFARPSKAAKPAKLDEAGQEVSPATEEVPGIEGVEYVDLEFITNPQTGEPWYLPKEKQIAYIPKVMARGEKKGQFTVSRRENPAIYILYPKTVEETTEAAQ